MDILNNILDRGIIYEIGLMNSYSKQSTDELFRSIYFFQLEKSHTHGDHEWFSKIIKTIGVSTIILGFGLDQFCMWVWIKN
jgi:hypothetical protein